MLGMAGASTLLAWMLFRYTGAINCYGEYRRLKIHRILCDLNRNGGEKEIVGFAEYYLHNSLIKKIRGAACREIALFLLKLTEYFPKTAPVIVKDLLKNMRDAKRRNSVISHIKKNKEYRRASAILCTQIAIQTDLY